MLLVGKNGCNPTAIRVLLVRRGPDEHAPSHSSGNGSVRDHASRNVWTAFLLKAMGLKSSRCHKRARDLKDSVCSSQMLLRCWVFIRNSVPGMALCFPSYFEIGQEMAQKQFTPGKADGLNEHAVIPKNLISIKPLS